MNDGLPFLFLLSGRMGKLSVILAFVVGLALGFFGLFLWARFMAYPLVSWVLSLFSFFRFSITRWMVAVGLFILGVVLVPFKRSSALFLWGLAVALIFP